MAASRRSQRMLGICANPARRWRPQKRGWNLGRKNVGSPKTMVSNDLSAPSGREPVAPSASSTVTRPRSWQLVKLRYGSGLGIGRPSLYQHTSSSGSTGAFLIESDVREQQPRVASSSALEHVIIDCLLQVSFPIQIAYTQNRLLQ